MSSHKEDKFKRKLLSICFSSICYSSKYKNKVSGGVLKKVSFSTDFCPDCGHALYWTDYRGYKLVNEDGGNSETDV